MSWVAPAFILQVGPPDPCHTPQGIRVGYVASRKIGTAVARNKAKRRLREVVRRVFPEKASLSLDYVLIARRCVLTQDFAILSKDLVWAMGHLQRVHKERMENDKGMYG